MRESPPGGPTAADHTPPLHVQPAAYQRPVQKGSSRPDRIRCKKLELLRELCLSPGDDECQALPLPSPSPPSATASCTRSDAEQLHRRLSTWAVPARSPPFTAPTPQTHRVSFSGTARAVGHQRLAARGEALEGALSRLRTQFLTDEDKQAATPVFFALAPFHRDSVRRQLVNALTTLRVSLLPTEEQLTRLLHSVNLLDDVETLSYQQFILIVDQWKGSVLGAPRANRFLAGGASAVQQQQQLAVGLGGEETPINRERECIAAAVRALADAADGDPGVSDGANSPATVRAEQLCSAAQDLHIDLRALLPSCGSDEGGGGDGGRSLEAAVPVSPTSASSTPLRSREAAAGLVTAGLEDGGAGELIAVEDVAAMLVDDGDTLLQAFIGLGAFDPGELSTSRWRYAALRFERRRRAKAIGAARNDDIYDVADDDENFCDKSRVGGGQREDPDRPAPHFLGNEFWWQALQLPLPALCNGIAIPPGTIAQLLFDVGFGAGQPVEALEQQLCDPWTFIDFDTFSRIVSLHAHLAYGSTPGNGTSSSLSHINQSVAAAAAPPAAEQPAVLATPSRADRDDAQQSFATSPVGTAGRLALMSDSPALLTLGASVAHYSDTVAAASCLLSPVQQYRQIGPRASRGGRDQPCAGTDLSEALRRSVDAIQAPPRITASQPAMAEIRRVASKTTMARELQDIEPRVYEPITEERRALLEENIRCKAREPPPSLRRRPPVAGRPFVVSAVKYNLSTSEPLAPVIRHPALEPRHPRAAGEPPKNRPSPHRRQRDSCAPNTKRPTIPLAPRRETLSRSSRVPLRAVEVDTDVMDLEAALDRIHGSGHGIIRSPCPPPRPPRTPRHAAPQPIDWALLEGGDDDNAAFHAGLMASYKAAIAIR